MQSVNALTEIEHRVFRNLSGNKNELILKDDLHSWFKYHKEREDMLIELLDRAADRMSHSNELYKEIQNTLRQMR